MSVADRIISGSVFPIRTDWNDDWETGMVASVDTVCSSSAQTGVQAEASLGDRSGVVRNVGSWEEPAQELGHEGKPSLSLICM